MRNFETALDVLRNARELHNEAAVLYTYLRDESHDDRA